MCSRNCSDLLKKACLYAGCRPDRPDETIEAMCVRALEELRDLAQFQYRYAHFDAVIAELNKEPYRTFLQDAPGYYLIATTLGAAVDRRIHQLSQSDMPYMVVFNAAAAAYLEYLADAFEEENLPDGPFVRFCPGYGGSSVSDLTVLQNFLPIGKIGMEVRESGMLLPEKSMIGIVRQRPVRRKQQKKADSEA